jgi:hypothetical protein
LNHIVDAEGNIICTVTQGLQPAATDPSLLVINSITQHGARSKNPVDSIEVHHRAVKLVRHSVTYSPPVKTTPRGEIKSFTAKSRSRLKFLAANSPQLISHFLLSYHLSDPDGATVKSHLNRFCTALRRHFPGTQYLWVLEFQSRGKAHFHFFSNLEHAADNGHSLAYIWNRIAEPENPKHLQFHLHENNFMPWSMGTASYLTKYLNKDAQKAVPEGFHGIGRFWGASQKLLPQPLIIEVCDLVAAYGDKAVNSLVRTVGKHHEASLKHVKSPYKSGARKRRQSFTLPNGSGVFNKLCAIIPEIAPPDNLFSIEFEKLPY